MNKVIIKSIKQAALCIVCCLVSGSALEAQAPMFNGSNGGRGIPSSLFGPVRCTHNGRREYVPGVATGCWTNPRDGQLLFHNRFTNGTEAMQSYSAMVTGSVSSAVEGSIGLWEACAKVGTSTVVSLSQTYPVNVPPRSTVTMRAFANMMTSSFEVLETCGSCREVLAVGRAHVHAARGIHEYFN